MDDDKAIRDWLIGVMRVTGLKVTPLAKEAGLAPSTLIRALDENAPTALERRSIAKIVARFNVPEPYRQNSTSNYPSGFSDSELLALDYDAPTFAGAALLPNQYVRTINTRALELAGFLPGDQELFDMSVTARAADAVAATVYNLQHGSAETLLRLYDPPYLVARTMDANVRAKPLLVDNERVKIMAVGIITKRERAA